MFSNGTYCRFHNRLNKNRDYQHHRGFMKNIFKGEHGPVIFICGAVIIVFSALGFIGSIFWPPTSQEPATETALPSLDSNTQVIEGLVTAVTEDSKYFSLGFGYNSWHFKTSTEGLLPCDEVTVVCDSEGNARQILLKHRPEVLQLTYTGKTGKFIYNGYEVFFHSMVPYEGPAGEVFAYFQPDGVLVVVDSLK